MSLINVPDTYSFDLWRLAENLIAQYEGDLTLLNTVIKTDLVSAINEVNGNVSNLGKSVLVLAIAMA